MLAAWRFLERDDSRAALLFGTNIRRGIRHQVGATLDWPVGRRFFVRVDARLILFRVGIGGAGSASESRRSAVGGTRPRGSGRLVAPSPGTPPAGSGVRGVCETGGPLAAALKPHPHHFGQSGAERP